MKGTIPSRIGKDFACNARSWSKVGVITKKSNVTALADGRGC